jgi:hypothetical protein
VQVVDGFTVLEHLGAKMEKAARCSQKTTSRLPTDYPTDHAAQHRSQPGDGEHGFNRQMVVGDVDTGTEECHLAESVDSNAAEYGEKEKRHIVERRTLRAKMRLDMDSENAKIMAGMVAGVTSCNR